METHWHVGEEIAAAEKEALPEAKGSYWWLIGAKTGCDDTATILQPYWRGQNSRLFVVRIIFISHLRVSNPGRWNCIKLFSHLDL